MVAAVGLTTVIDHDSEEFTALAEEDAPSARRQCREFLGDVEVERFMTLIRVNNNATLNLSCRSVLWLHPQFYS